MIKVSTVEGEIQGVTDVQPTTEQLVLYFTKMTDNHIQSKIDAYNKANGTAFASVHNCESYSRMSAYTHQPFCAAVWTWSVDVWEAVRSYQSTLTTIPTDAEFQAVLDSVTQTW